MEKKGGIKNPTRSVNVKQRFVDVEARVKDLERELHKTETLLHILQQRVTDCQEAERERNKMLSEAKQDWKSYVGWILALASLALGIAGWLR